MPNPPTTAKKKDNKAKHFFGGLRATPILNHFLDFHIFGGGSYRTIFWVFEFFLEVSELVSSSNQFLEFSHFWGGLRAKPISNHFLDFQVFLVVSEHKPILNRFLEFSSFFGGLKRPFFGIF
jgi:hypothetical protein